VTRYATIAGVGSALPPRLVLNSWFETIVDTNDEWIRDRTGIEARHFADEGTNTSDLATEATRSALDAAGIPAEQLDMLICATVTGDTIFPATAVWVQQKLGISCPAYDLNAACSGFSYGLAQATAFIDSGMADTVIVIGAEIFSRIVDFSDRGTCILFGDGAGAAVVRSGGPGRIGPIVLHADPHDGPACINASHAERKIRMRGQDTFRAAVARLAESTLEAVTTAGLQLEDVDLFVYHQANTRIIGAVGERLGLPGDRVIDCIERYGNTSAASIPIALREAERLGRLPDGATVLVGAFAAGFVWGAGVIEWGSER
jgi:3-oxoacyl-[acyl-carrier-protein] synthase III